MVSCAPIVNRCRPGAKTLLPLACEEIKHGGDGRGSHAGVASAVDFDIDDVGAGFPSGFHHAAGLRDGHGAVIVAVGDVLGNVADFGHAGRSAAAGDGSEGGEEISHIPEYVT